MSTSFSSGENLGGADPRRWRRGSALPARPIYWWRSPAASLPGRVQDRPGEGGGALPRLRGHHSGLGRCGPEGRGAPRHPWHHGCARCRHAAATRRARSSPGHGVPDTQRGPTRGPAKPIGRALRARRSGPSTGAASSRSSPQRPGKRPPAGPGRSGLRRPGTAAPRPPGGRTRAGTTEPLSVTAAAPIVAALGSLRSVLSRRTLPRLSAVKASHPGRFRPLSRSNPVENPRFLSVHHRFGEQNGCFVDRARSCGLVRLSTRPW